MRGGCVVGEGDPEARSKIDGAQNIHSLPFPVENDRVDLNPRTALFGY